MMVDLRLSQSLDAPRVATLTTAELIAKVSGLIQQVFIMVGFKPPAPADMAILTAKLTADLQESYAGLTVQEISLCFEYGSKGEYGDFLGVNLRTLSGWLKKYKTSDRRYRAIVSREQQKQKKALTTVSESYKEESERSFLQRMYDSYQQGEAIENLYPVVVYNWLQKRKLINDSPEVKWAAMKEAKTRIKPRGNLQFSTEHQDYLVRRQAMANLLRTHFDNWIAQEKKQI